MRWKDDVDDGEAGGGERGGRGDSRCANKEDEDPGGCCEAWRLFRTRAVVTRPSRMGSCCAEAVVQVNRGGSKIAVGYHIAVSVCELIQGLHYPAINHTEYMRYSDLHVVNDEGERLMYKNGVNMRQKMAKSWSNTRW